LVDNKEEAVTKCMKSISTVLLWIIAICLHTYLWF
jgi:hypothetical protein